MCTCVACTHRWYAGVIKETRKKTEIVMRHQAHRGFCLLCTGITSEEQTPKKRTNNFLWCQPYLRAVEGYHSRNLSTRVWQLFASSASHKISCINKIANLYSLQYFAYGMEDVSAYFCSPNQSLKKGLRTRQTRGLDEKGLANLTDDLC